ncbi:MAG: prepilin-type N-terminal cleavage/methylation domain-containing protein [Candidatus Liptonbacteria bacterium]|nr:prepilin-type N-terminal cleavage/methylation domain-containing protein [Candidatus Liptonbacteria bacterium]
MNRRGFTLIELLVVVGIIGLLSSVTLVGLGSFRARGRDARRVADLREVQNALELYYTSEQAYPDAGTGWAGMVGAITSASIGVRSLPSTGPSGDAYYYGVDTGGVPQNQSYVLKAILEDPANPALANSTRGTIYGVECGSLTAGNKEYYCVQF